MTDGLRFDWDEANIAYIAVHGITPEEVEEALRGDTIELKQEVRNGETRVTEIGQTSGKRIIVVVTTFRRGDIRVVTAWPSDQKRKAAWNAAQETA